MKLTIPRLPLLATLKLLHGLPQRSVSMPILKYIRIDATPTTLLLNGTDLEIGIQQRLDVSCQGNRTFIVPTEPLLEFIRELNTETIDWQLDADKNLTVQAGKTKAKFKLANPSDYPTLPAPPQPLLFTLPASDIDALLQETLPAVGDADARYIFNAIRLSLLEGDGPTMELVGTDGKRLVKTHRATGTWLTTDHETKTALLPKKAGKLLATMLGQSEAPTIGVGLSPTMIGFHLGTLCLTSRLMEGSFPKIEGALPKPTAPLFSLPKLHFEDPLRRVSVINGRDGKPIRLQIRSHDIILNATNVDLGEATESIDRPEPGRELTVGFNTLFLLDALESMPGEHCHIHMESPLSPCLLTTPERPEWRHVVMPIQLPT